MAIITKRKKQNWKVFLYSPPGIGKTTLALKAPEPLLLDIEKGSRLLGDVRRIDEESNPLETSEQIIEALREGYADIDTKTIVVDSATALNKIFENEVLSEMGIPSLITNYGSGYTPLKQKWERFLEVTTNIAIKGHKNVILIGHNETKNEHEALIGNDVKKESIHINKKVFKDVVADFDGVFFLGFEKIFDEKKRIAKGTGRRILKTTGTDDLYTAKSRFQGLEPTIYFNHGDEQAMVDFWNKL